MLYAERFTRSIQHTFDSTNTVPKCPTTKPLLKKHLFKYLHHTLVKPIHQSQRLLLEHFYLRENWP